MRLTAQTQTATQSKCSQVFERRKEAEIVNPTVPIKKLEIPSTTPFFGEPGLAAIPAMSPPMNVSTTMSRTSRNTTSQRTCFRPESSGGGSLTGRGSSMLRYSHCKSSMTTQKYGGNASNVPHCTNAARLTRTGPAKLNLARAGRAQHRCQAQDTPSEFQSPGKAPVTAAADARPPLSRSIIWV
jgi:hypothetical protein